MLERAGTGDSVYPEYAKMGSSRDAVMHLERPFTRP